MKRFNIIGFVTLLFLLHFSIESWSAEDNITILRNQISSLEKQKEQLEAEKRMLITEGDELSYKIEDLKIQAQGGLGIIGRYKLSRNLRKAQRLSEEIQALEKRIYEVENELEEKRSVLEKEYESQIAYLMQKLNGAEGKKIGLKTEEKRIMLGKIQEYRFEKEQLTKSRKGKEEHLDVVKIEIAEHDSPKEIREKADLISDVANKTNARITLLDSRIKKLKDELKTRKKLGEFAYEISFFGERVSREEIVSKSAGKPEKAATEETAEKATKPDETTTPTETDTFTRTTVETPEPETPGSALESTPAEATATVKKFMKSNGISADFAETPLYRIDEEIRLLERQKQDLKKKLSILSEKVSTFRKKADEIEKSETKTGETKRRKGQ